MNSSRPISALERPVGDQAEDLALACRQLLELPRAARPRVARELPDHALGDGGREERVAGGDGPDRRDQLLGRVVLEHEAAGAGAERLVDVLVEVEGREDEDPRGRVGGEDAPGRLEAVELRHADVHQDDGRVEARRLGDGLVAVLRLGDDVDVLLAGRGACRKPARTIDWSSATRTRMLIGRSPASGRRVLSTKPPPFALPAVISPP